MTRFAAPLAALTLAALAATLRSAPDAPATVRVPLTTSRVTGSPEPPPPYRSRNPFPKLKFRKPVHLRLIPGSDRWVVVEQDGRLWSFTGHPDAAKPDLFLDAPTELQQLGTLAGAKGLETTYAVAFHPKFPAVREAFLAYTLRPKSGKNLEDGTRVSRFRVTTAEPPRLDPTSEEVLLTFTQGGHNGCDLAFGPDGMLYVSTGDSADPSPPDPRRTGQDITDLLSSILRIDVDRRDAGKSYAVPADNPFVRAEQGGKPARPEVWAFGFRNPWRMSFDRGTGDLWVGDVGWEAWEMVHRVTKGFNGGWSLVEGPQKVNPNDRPGPTPATPALIELPHSVAASVTGGYVYRGKRFPELVGVYVFGDWETRRVWGARFRDGRLESMPELVPPAERIITFAEDAGGELFWMDYDTGTVHTLEPNPAASTAANADYPRTLSETGLFASLPGRTPAAGVVPFAINAPQWQDHATATHWLALPGESRIKEYTEKRPIPGLVSWRSFRYHFPKDGVLVKTLSLERERDNPETARPVETQLLHWDGSDWRGTTYAWRDDGSDADLVPASGAEKTLSVRDDRHVGGVREQVWTYAGRAQCAQCHNAWSEVTLAFSAEQLNRDAGGENQLVRLSRMGVFDRRDKKDKPLPPLTPAEAAKLPKLADATASLAGRARSYLHANCAHCHRFGAGGSVDLELDAFHDLKATGVLDRPPRAGGFDLADARVIAPGSPERSVLLYRMAKFGRGRMPHVGSELVDENAVALMAEWIRSLGPPAPAPSDWRRDPSAALALACDLGSRRAAVLAVAGTLPPGHVRDLFDGYLPQTGERKLGPNPDPEKILRLAGDAAKGGELLRSNRAQCLNCHQVDGAGKNVGPELTRIGQGRTRRELLESLLEPSRRIEPQYQAHLARTVDGRAITGLIVARTPAGVTLRDGEGKEYALANDDVEELRPSAVSLMPSGALADLTAQEAADLLANLAGRK